MRQGSNNASFLHRPLINKVGKSTEKNYDEYLFYEYDIIKILLEILFRKKYNQSPMYLKKIVS